MKNRNLSFSLTIYLLISEILLSIMIIFMGYRFTRNSIYNSLLYQVKYQTTSTIEPISASIGNTKNLIDVLAIEIGKSDNLKETERLLDLAIKLNPEILGINYLTTDELNPKSYKYLINYYREKDEIVRSTIPGIENSKWLTGISDTMTFGWIIPQKDTIPSPNIAHYTKVSNYTSKGKTNKAIIFCTVSLDQTLNNLKNLQIQKSGFPILISESGTVVFHPNKNLIGQNISELFKCLDGENIDLKSIVANRLTGTQFIHPRCMDRNKSVAVYWPIGLINWTVLLVIPESELLSELNRMIALIILLILFVGSITAAATIYLSIKLVSPINVLVKDSIKILEEEGMNWPRRRNEIEVLAEGIELMKNRLDNYKKDSIQKSIDRAEIDRELNLAKDIEMGMVPTQFPIYPDRTDFDCYGRLIPAKIVGGDLFDIFLVDENHLFISICDTLGKGIPAAMFSVVTRTLIRSLSNPITRMGKIMEQLNEELSLDGRSEMFVTVFLAKLDLRNGELTYCNAGHPRPYIARSNRMVEELKTSHGIPVGVRKKISFKESTAHLNHGDSLIAYTDGISEEIDEIGEFYGSERLVSVIRMFAKDSPEKLVEEILNSLDKFKEKSETSDDITIVTLKYYGKQEKTL